MRLFARALVAPILLLPTLGLAEDGSRPLPADASFPGDPAAGFEIAAGVCASCHAVAPGDRRSPDSNATPFATIAATPGMTARAINVWLTTFHPERTMPALVLDRTEREDIIAYIHSLSE